MPQIVAIGYIATSFTSSQMRDIEVCIGPVNAFKVSGEFKVMVSTLSHRYSCRSARGAVWPARSRRSIRSAAGYRTDTVENRGALRVW